MSRTLHATLLYTTVKNTSGARKKFTFLPPHGKELAAGEEYVLFGSLHDAVCGADRAVARRNILALEKALQNGDLTVVHTPSPVLESKIAAQAPKVLTLDNTNQLTTTPSYVPSEEL